MMIWIPDQTGRFRKRPYFLLDALDRRCERVIEQFTVSLYGHFTTPVPTGGLIKLLEKYAADVNLYADLSREGEGVRRSPDSFPDRKEADGAHCPGTISGSLFVRIAADMRWHTNMGTFIFTLRLGGGVG